MGFLPFHKRQDLDSSKLKELADNNFRCDENGRKFSKRVENTVGKRRNCSIRAISPFSHSVFKRPVLQTSENQGLFGRGLKENVKRVSQLCCHGLCHYCHKKTDFL